MLISPSSSFFSSFTSSSSLLSLFYTLWLFLHQCWLVVFHWSLNDRKSFWVSSSLLSVLATINNAVVCRVWILPLIFNSPSLSSKAFGTIPSTPITMGITVTFMFHSFLCSLARSKYLSNFLLSFIFTQWLARMAKSTRQLLFFFLSAPGIAIWQGLGDPFLSQNPCKFYAFIISIIILFDFFTSIRAFSEVWMIASSLSLSGLFQAF